MDRRHAIKAGIAGAFSLWTAPLLQAGVAGRDPRSGPGLGDPQVGPGSRPNGSIRKLSDRLSVLDAGGTNVVALSASDGLTLVDTGMRTP